MTCLARIVRAVGRYERIAELADLTGGAADPEPVELADLAAGQGRMARALLTAATERGVPLRLHAVDTSSDLDDDVLHDERVRSVLADAARPLPFADGALDRVVSLNVAEHLTDPAAHLADCYRVLRPGGLLVLAHSDWDTAMFSSPDDELTRQLVSRFVAECPPWAQRCDGFMGRKLLSLGLDSPLELISVQTWADAHLRFDEGSVGWKVAMGVLAASRDEPRLAARAASWVEGLQKLAAQGRFLFTVTDVAVVLRRP